MVGWFDSNEMETDDDGDDGDVGKEGVSRCLYTPTSYSTSRSSVTHLHYLLLLSWHRPGLFLVLSDDAEALYEAECYGNMLRYVVGGLLVRSACTGVLYGVGIR